MRRLANFLVCNFALFAANMRAHIFGFRRTAFMSVAMFLQNVMFFVAWIVFFGAIKQVRGWQLQEVAVMYGIVASSIGLALLFSEGIRYLPAMILDGSLETFVARPRHPLPSVLFSQVGPANFGDIMTGPVLWFTIGGAGADRILLLAAVTLLSAVISVSTCVVIYSAVFWIRRGKRFSEQMFESLIVFSSTPQHGQSMGIKLVMFSVLPAGFIALLPVYIVRDFDMGMLAVLFAAAVFYAVISVLFFNAGLRRYVAG